MQLVFLLIFMVFIFLNVILGLVSSRKKRKRQAAEMHRREETAEQKPERLEESFKEHREYEEGPKITPGAGPHIKPPSVAEEVSSTLSGKPHGVSIKGPSQPPVVRKIFPVTSDVSFLHEQTADNIFAPQYTLSEEIQPSPEQEPKPQEQAETFDFRFGPGDAGMPPETGIKRPAISAVQKLEAFPPLKRAIVFSEILGIPKGLSGF